MYVHCMYGLGSHPVPKRNIRITYSLGSDRFPLTIKNQCAFGSGSHLDVHTGLYVQCTYGSVRTMYVHVRTYIVRKQTKYG